MPYEEHPIFEPPADRNVTIWRYLSLGKFVSLLATRSLYFARADRLGDPFEGAYSRANRERQAELYADLPAETRRRMFDSITPILREMPKHVVINCWHMNEHESAALWKLYANGNEAVAIRSTYSSLIECFTPDTPSVYVGVVKYIDYGSGGEIMPEGNLFFPFLHKRKSFEHERELRAIVAQWPPAFRFGGTEAIPQGLPVSVNLQTLLAEVRVAPAASDWFADAVRAVMDRFEVPCAVVQSQLDELPDW